MNKKMNPVVSAEANVRLHLAKKAPRLRALHGLVGFARRKPLGAIGLFTMIVLVMAACIPGFIAPQSYDEIDILNRFQSPSSSHVFGTDNQGRDVFSRIVFGARTSVVIGFGVVLVAALLSALIGTVSGFYGGVVDIVIQRLIDIWQAFPGIVFVIFLLSIFETSTWTLIIALGLIFTAGSSRVIRSSVLQNKQSLYVDAARALGAPDLRIMLWHILPNTFPIIIINASVQVGAVILIESSLSFLGFGVPPPFPSWGGMLQAAQADMQQHPYLAVFPGLAIALTVYSLNMLGDALRDVLDPRMRGSK